MTVKVQTTKGLIERDNLKVYDYIRETDDARVIDTVWLFGEEEVRRDVTVSILRGIDLGGSQGV